MRLIAPVLMLCLAASAGAEVVHLNDGSTVTGDVKRSGEGWQVTDAQGKVQYIGADRVKEIELTSKFSDPKEAADARLASIRQSTQNSGDTNAVIARYQAFIDQNKDQPSVHEAQKDLSVWQERHDRGMVRVGGKWVTKEEAGSIAEKSTGTADQARLLIKQGRLRDADAMIQQALVADPHNASALYLDGVLKYQQDQMGAAMKDFQGVDKIVPDHAPTLNNVAVVYSRQNNPAAALNNYDHAMQVSPLNKQVLANVAEALNSTPADQKNTALYQKVNRRFTEQHAQLEDKMMQLGWYRWGSSWVDKTQYEQLKASEAEIRQKLDALSGEYENTQQRVQRIERDIDDNLRVMRRMDVMSYATDPNTGLTFRTAPPRSYTDLDQDNRKLSAERAQLLAKLDSIRDSAKQTEQRLPTPRFTGVQQLIGIEGTPNLAAMAPIMPDVPAAPTTQAAPAPPATPAAPGPVLNK